MTKSPTAGVSSREPRGPAGPITADETSSSPRRLRRRGSLILVVPLLMVAVPVAASDAVRCRAFGAGCPAAERPAPAVPRATEPRATRPPSPSPAELAVRGRYVALGDSYASGEGAYATAADVASGNRCHRTSQSYVHSLARTFRFAGGTRFRACSGATTRDVLAGRGGEPSQAAQVDRRTSLVTMSVGGNDVGFARVLARCVVTTAEAGGCRAQSDQIADRMAGLRRTLPEVLRAIRGKAPSARVLVLGYPRIFAETTAGGFGGIAVADQQWLNARGRDLNQLIRGAVREADQRIVASGGVGSVEFVDASSGFAGHEVGSPEPFVNGLQVDLATLAVQPRSFHPTTAGYQRLAGLFARQIRTGPGRPLARDR